MVLFEILSDYFGAEVIVLPGMVSAASFGKYVVISDEDYANNREEILTHEQGHRQLGHVFDLTLLTVALKKSMTDYLEKLLLCLCQTKKTT